MIFDGGGDDVGVGGVVGSGRRDKVRKLVIQTNAIMKRLRLRVMRGVFDVSHTDPSLSEHDECNSIVMHTQN